MLDREYLGPLELTPADVAERTRLAEEEVRAIREGGRAVDEAAASALGRLFGTPAGFWLRLQRNREVWESLYGGRPLRIRAVRPADRSAEVRGVDGQQAERLRELVGSRRR